jgi:TatD DNase family protein
MFTDTHAHIYVDDFQNDLEDVLHRAGELGVKHICMPNIDSSSIAAMHDVEKKYPNCFAMMGLHPCHINETYEEELKIVSSWLEKRRYIAIGEIGIDLYWDKTFAKEQEIAFRRQIEWAVGYKLPIVIHSRESLDLTISIVSEYKNTGITGIFHCFNGSLEQAKKIMDIGFYMGIGGVVTYKNAGVDVVVSQIPLENIVLETDSPYLAPVPNRGKRNEPVFLVDVARKVSELSGKNIEEIAAVTTNNAKKIFSDTTFEW